MPVSSSQRQTMITNATGLARQATNWNRSYNAFREEWDAEDYGTAIQQADVDAVLGANGLLKTELVDGVSAMDAVSTEIETNKTNLYKLAR